MTKPKTNPDVRFRCRITAEQAARVRLDRAAGRSLTEIAKELGVARSSIQAIVAGRTHRVSTE